MGVVVITPPVPDIDLELVKSHLRVEHDDDDVLIQAYISAACAYVDGPQGILGRAIWTQTLELRQNVFCGPIHLPYGPVAAVASIAYVDPYGAEQTLDDTGYVLRTGDIVGLTYGASWPALRGDAEGVRIQYVTGEDEAPTAIVQALLLLIGHWYANRETVNVGNITSQLPLATQALLAPYRDVRV